MDEHLLACEAKLRRVEEQLADLKAIILDYLANSYPILRDVDAERRELTFKLGEFAQPPVEISLLGGEVLHNLRSPLDYLVCAFLRSEGIRRRDYHAFPITLTEDAFRKTSKRRLEGLSPAVVAAIDRQQPYHRPHPEQHPLWLLSMFNNIDKHRLIPTASTVNFRGNMHIIGAYSGYSVTSTAAVEALKPGADLRSLTVAPGPALEEVEVQFQMARDVFFSNPEAVGKTYFPAFNTILEIRAYLHDHVFTEQGLAGTVGWAPTSSFELTQFAPLRSNTGWITPI